MDQKNEWSKQAERILVTGKTPHFAPRKETLKVHLSLINSIKEQHKKPAVVILGATPELANLALEQQCIVYRVDNNPAMFAAAKPRETIAQRDNESIIHSNWSDINTLANGQIDFVMGDASLNNVPVAQMHQVLNELNRITHSGSVFSLKQIVISDVVIDDYTFENSVTAYRKGLLTDDEFYLILRFYSFHHLAYDPEAHILDAGIVFDAIQQQHVNARLNDDEYEIFAQRRGALKHTVYKKTEQTNLFNEFLGDTDVLYPNDSCVYRDIFNMFSIVRK